jgi:hypothetical protein
MNTLATLVHNSDNVIRVNHILSKIFTNKKKGPDKSPLSYNAVDPLSIPWTFDGI